ncbi:MAG TPA: alpha/beta hydrolase [Gemmatimonadales bacterium]|nr:alpha/beta hydrolase [Gemmatimonadales bacterium]
MPTPLREHVVPVAGVRSVVREGGPAGDEAVVFVHGNPGSSQDWEPLGAQVADFARVIAPDMPGFGHADKPRTFEYTVEGYARHLAGLLDVLGVRRAHLVLHDFGGPWGLVWAAMNHSRYASTTLINCGVLPGYQWHRFARIWRTPILGELSQLLSTRAGWHKVLNHGQSRPLPPAFVDRMYDDYDAGTKRAVLRLYRATEPGRNAARLQAALRPLDRPTLVVWGARDPYIDVTYAERQRETFASATVHVLPDSGHWPFADDPERVAALVVPFLKTQTRGS